VFANRTSIAVLTAFVVRDSAVGGNPALIEKRLGYSLYGPKFTVTVLEQVWVPASHT
jgi:hypothetical protein